MFNRLSVISLGNWPRKIGRLGMGTMTTLSRNQVGEIARRIGISFQPQPFHKILFYPPKTCMIRRLGNQALSLREVLQEQRITPLSLSVV